MQKVNEPVHVIGAGLAGCEAAWQLAQRGVPVILYEKRPLKSDAAHKTDKFAEKPINLQNLCAAIRCAQAI